MAGLQKTICRVFLRPLSGQWLLFSASRPAAPKAAEELLLGECELLFQKAV